MSLNYFLSTTLFIFLAVISPGPDFLVVVKNTTIFGRRYGVLTAIGVASGAVFLASISILGLSTLSSYVPNFHSIFKYLGAIYLFYLGVQLLLSKSDRLQVKPEPLHDNKTCNKMLFKAYMEGLLTSTLNPKSLLFFTSLFSFIVRADTKSIYLIGFSFEISLLYFFWFTGLAYTICFYPFSKNLSRFYFFVGKIFGVFLIAISLCMVFL